MACSDTQHDLSSVEVNMYRCQRWKGLRSSGPKPVQCVVSLHRNSRWYGIPRATCRFRLDLDLIRYGIVLSAGSTDWGVVTKFCRQLFLKFISKGAESERSAGNIRCSRPCCRQDFFPSHGCANCNLCIRLLSTAGRHRRID